MNNNINNSRFKINELINKCTKILVFNAFYITSIFQNLFTIGFKNICPEINNKFKFLLQQILIKNMNMNLNLNKK